MSFITKFSDFCNGFELQYGKSPSHIYHYTSPVGAMGVIENNTLRFTDRNYLNDYSEGMYTLDLQEVSVRQMRKAISQQYMKLPILLRLQRVQQ